jgi:hypothetical protein
MITGAGTGRSIDYIVVSVRAIEARQPAATTA